MLRRMFILAAIPALLAAPARAYDREDYEEEAGSTFAVLLNPADDIYGISLGSGVWLKGTPVFGDYFLRLFWNGIEDATYSSVGMTLRLMPHWALAPFAGGGGSYNYSLATKTEDGFAADNPGDLPDRGESYWGGHAEAGLRLAVPERNLRVEAALSQTWSSLAGDRDYWLLALSVGGSF